MKNQFMHRVFATSKGTLFIKAGNTLTIIRGGNCAVLTHAPDVAEVTLTMAGTGYQATVKAKAARPGNFKLLTAYRDSLEILYSDYDLKNYEAWRPIAEGESLPITAGFTVKNTVH